MTTRGPGRPEIGGLIRAKIGADLRARLDEWANQHGMTRSEAIRSLIQTGLAQEDKMITRDQLAQQLTTEYGITPNMDDIDVLCGQLQDEDLYDTERDLLTPAGAELIRDQILSSR